MQEISKNSYENWVEELSVDLTEENHEEITYNCDAANTDNCFI